MTAQVGDISNQAEGLSSIAGEMGNFLRWIGAIEYGPTQLRRVA